VNVRIPGENETKFAPKVEAKAPRKSSSRNPSPRRSSPRKESRQQKGSRRRVRRAGRRFRHPEGAIAKLAAAGVPHYTEAVKGKPDARARGAVREP